MELKKKIFIKGKIKTISGLHIGGTNIGLQVGGADSIVIRNPISFEPYIPGSSLKGKMRSLIEKLTGQVSEDGSHCKCGQCEICKLFGVGASGSNFQPTRLIVRDSYLTQDSKNLLEESDNTDMEYTEVKTETVINRLTSAATPRQIERVPAGVDFKFSLVLNIYDEEKEEEYLKQIFESLILVQGDYLGGGGSRGNGEVKITIENISEKDKKIYEKNETAQEKVIGIPEELK